MIGLLYAEWLRLRRRRDVWFVALALAALSSLAYISGLAGAQSGPGGDIPPEMVKQVEEGIRQNLLQYAFPESIGTVVQNGQILVLVLVAYLAAATSGAEFAYGTIRTSLVAHSDRGGFLIVRLASLMVTSLLLIGLLVVLGALLPLGATLLGTNFAPVPDLSVGVVAGTLGVLCLAAGFAIGLTTLWAILIRNAAIALVLSVAYILIEGAIAGLIVRFAGAESVLRWLLPVANLQLLFDRARGGATGAVMPTLLAIAVAIAWVLALWAAGVMVLARADIRD